MNDVEITVRCVQNFRMRMVKATRPAIFAGWITLSILALSGCGSDQTAGVVFGSDPTATPEESAESAALRAPTRTPDPN